MSYPVWICDGCDEIVSLRRVGENGYCAGSLTMGTAHERRPMRATTVVPAVLSPETVEKAARAIDDEARGGLDGIRDEREDGLDGFAREALRAAGFVSEPSTGGDDG